MPVRIDLIEVISSRPSLFISTIGIEVLLSEFGLWEHSKPPLHVCQLWKRVGFQHQSCTELHPLLGQPQMKWIREAPDSSWRSSVGTCSLPCSLWSVNAGLVTSFSKNQIIQQGIGAFCSARCLFHGHYSKLQDSSTLSFRIPCGHNIPPQRMAVTWRFTTDLIFQAVLSVQMAVNHQISNGKYQDIYNICGLELQRKMLVSTRLKMRLPPGHFRFLYSWATNCFL